MKGEIPRNSCGPVHGAEEEKETPACIFIQSSPGLVPYRLFNSLQIGMIEWYIRLFMYGISYLFVGYSFGGSLAQAVFARMLKGNLFNQDFLISNVCCITFGEPLSCNSFLAEEMRKRQNLMSCFHQIYLEYDLHTMQDVDLLSLVRTIYECIILQCNFCTIYMCKLSIRSFCIPVFYDRQMITGRCRTVCVT